MLPLCSHFGPLCSIGALEEMEHKHGLYSELVKKSHTIDQKSVQCLPFEEIERDLHRWEWPS